MSCFIYFIPILVFVSIFVGSGLYFTIIGAQNAFYQLSPLTAIMPAIGLGWIFHGGNVHDRMNAFLDGARHRDIMCMCIIFLLAGAFSEATKSIGSVDATVQLSLTFVPSQFLLIGLFLTSAFIATAIGTSMGTIATIAPIAIELARQAGFSEALSVGTVVGGAMFGDNLSIISDTTIAAVMSQEADMKAKLKLNAGIAAVASVITIIFLVISVGEIAPIKAGEYSLLLVSPYVFLILLASYGVNVFIALTVSLVFTGVIGFATNANYSILLLSQNITQGFASMNEIMILSMMVGGLSGLASKGSQEFSNRLSDWIKISGGPRMAQMCIAGVVSVFDILLANNTIAIIFSGEIARNIAKKHRVPAHYSAAWLDIFSCVFQGIIPYGAQILLASAIAGVSPLAVVPHVYYCYVLGVVAMMYILFGKTYIAK